MRKHQNHLLQSLNETILKLMETHDAFMIVCPKRVQLRVSWRLSLPQVEQTSMFA